MAATIRLSARVPWAEGPVAGLGINPAPAMSRCGDFKGLRWEVLCVVEHVRDGLGDGGADLDAVLCLVVDDAKLEGFEQRSLDLGCGVAQLAAQVGDSLKRMP